MRLVKAEIFKKIPEIEMLEALVVYVDDVGFRA